MEFTFTHHCFFRLLEIRSRLYELLTHCIPPDVILKVTWYSRELLITYAIVKKYPAMRALTLMVGLRIWLCHILGIRISPFDQERFGQIFRRGFQVSFLSSLWFGSTSARCVDFEASYVHELHKVVTFPHPPPPPPTPCRAIPWGGIAISSQTSHTAYSFTRCV